MTSLPAVPHSLPPLARSLVPRALASPCLALPSLPSSPPGPLAAAGRPARSGALRGAPRLPLQPPVPSRGAPDACGRPRGSTERRRHGRGVCAGDQVSGNLSPRSPARPPGPALPAPLRAPRPPAPAPRGSRRAPLPSCLSPLLSPGLCSRWEGLGLPEVPGMGPGPGLPAPGPGLPSERASERARGVPGLGEAGRGRRAAEGMRPARYLALSHPA